MNSARLATVVVLATTGGLLATVTAATAASAATSCTSPVYKRQFYANTTFSGTPKKTDCDSTISENWGTKAPASGLPTNNFGVRWTVTRDFGSGGPFAFTAAAQDGVRVYVDGVLKISAWKNVSSTVTRTLNLTIAKGRHTLRVDYVNWTGAANVKFTYAPRTSATVDTVRPLAPTGAAWDYITDPGGGTTTALSWAANKEMDLAGYRVYRRVSTATAWTRVGATTIRTFSDVAPPTGQSYVYQIRAYDKAGNESAGTAALGPVPTPDLTAPTAPVLTVTPTVDSNVLSWTAPADAVAFSVLRRVTDGVTWTEHPDITATTWTDTGAVYGRSYDYKIVAYDAAWNRSESAVVSGRPTIPVPQHVTATAPDAVVIGWTEPSGSDTADYRVYRSPAAGTRTWTVADCRSRTTSTDAAGDTVHSCTDWGGDRGVPYVYRVTRKDAYDRWSSPSQEVFATRPGDEIAPPAVTGLTAQALEYGVKLDWDPSTAADLDKYWIYEQPTQYQEPQYIGTVDGTKSEAVLHMAANGESKRYVVLAVDRWGNVASYSGWEWSQPVAIAEVTELDLSPTTVPEVTACDLSAGAVASGDVVVDPFCSGARFTETDGYHVYRWDRSEKTWVRLTDTPATTSYWTDTTAPAGTTLYYLVSFTETDGTEAFTNVAAAVTRP